MKCKNCGGELIIKDNIGICSSCNSQHKIDSVFENTEVCICYIENDANGRRTKDSIIAAEVYKKLESKKISTFFERISAGDTVGDDLESLRLSATSNAKVLVLVGTNTQNFSVLYEKYSDKLNGKKVIPVISDMKPEQLPDEFRRFQASNFNSIGALNDLSISVLNILGREKEVELEEIYDKKVKRKKIITIVLCSLIASIVCVSAVLAFIFLSDKEKPAVIITDSDIYNSAMKFLKEEKYLEAATEFKKIPDYKDSVNQVKKIYDRYDGYFQSKDQGHTLYLNLIDGETANFTFEKIIDKKIVKIEESMVINDNKISGQYIDNLTNEGNITIKLHNDKVTVEVTTTTENNKVFIGKESVEFLLKDKSDRPQIKTVSKELLLDWIKTPTSFEDLKAMGYEFEFVDNSGPYDTTFGAQHRIANTDISVIVSDYDLSAYNGEKQWDYDSLPVLDEEIIIAIFAPADFICSDKIGKSAKAFTKDNVVYVPNANSLSEIRYSDICLINFNLESHQSSGITMDTTNVAANSQVGITSKAVAGNHNYQLIIKYNEDIYRRTVAVKQHKKDHPDEVESHSINVIFLKEKNNALLTCVHVRRTYSGLDYPNTIGSFYFYRIDLSSYKCSLILRKNDVGYINAYGSKTYEYDIWESYPEYFSEFLDEQDKPDEDEHQEPNPGDDSYTVTINSACPIYSESSSTSDYVQDLEVGVYTIVEEQYDDGYLWGKLKSGIGWICLDDIQ